MRNNNTALAAQLKAFALLAESKVEAEAFDEADSLFSFYYDVKEA